MVSSFAYLANVARQAMRGLSSDSSARAPRSLALSLHMGKLAAVDTETNTAQFIVNGSAVQIPGVRYLQAYTADAPPAAGDVVWAHHNGTDLLILGQHVVPTSTVILP